MPGGETGWAQLTAEGGHPGNTRAQACVRRWTAPADGVIKISGTLKHEPTEGDGVHAFIVSSRHGELQSGKVHAGQMELGATNIAVRVGDTVDFVVHIGATLSYDQFLWAPVIQLMDAADKPVTATHHARKDFSGPTPVPAWLKPWEQYAQVLLLANEFAFVD